MLGTMSHRLTLGIDVGGTTIKTGLVDRRGTIEQFGRVATPLGDATAAATVALIVELVERHARLADISAVGLVVPGIVDELDGRVVAAVNLGWAELPLRDLVQGNIALPLFFGQDVRSGALAEATIGDGGHRDGVSVFVPLGTGIAAAIVVDGRPLIAGGWAGEIGQVAVPPTPSRAGIVPLSLENVASASAIARRLGCVDARAAAELVHAGDERAEIVWSDAVDAIADSLAWMTAVVGADRIIVGGGLAESGDLLMTPLAIALDARLGVLRRPALSRARLGDRAGAIGAGVLAHALVTA